MSSQPQQQRSLPERLSLAIALLLLALVVGAVVTLWLTTPDTPPSFGITGSPAVQQGDHYHLPVRVENRGGRAAREVQIEGALPDGTAADATLDVIAAGGTAEVTLVFRSNPADAVLRVVSFQER